MNFVAIAHFNSRLEAEALGHALDAFDIPFLVQSPDIGIFGPGMTGFSPVGASLCVPDNRADEAKQLLRCAVGPAEGDDGAWDHIPELAPDDDEP